MVEEDINGAAKIAYPPEFSEDEDDVMMDFVSGR
jgi:hypothetical protein